MNKVVFPLSVVIGCLILGVSFYMVQVQKQESIERQQNIELQYKKEKDLADMQKQDQLDLVKYEQNRRTECLDIYKTESDKWNNTTGYEYVSEDDICYVSYKSQQGEWDGVVCDDIGENWNYELWGIDSRFTREMFRDRSNCLSEEFEKEF